MTDITRVQVPSPLPGSAYDTGRMKPRDLLSISAFWLATNLHWMALLQILMPAQMERIAPEHKAEALGMVLASGAWIAAIIPAIGGAFSDRCASRWGRRRPYITVGVGINLLGLALLWIAGVDRSLTFYLLGYLVVQLGNGIASGAYSGVIPDLVHTQQRGEASGYMAALAQTGSILGAFASGILVGKGYLGLSFMLIAVVMVLGLGVTLVGVRERPLCAAPPPFEWKRFLQGFWIDPRKHPDFAWVWLTRALVTLGLWTVQPEIQYFLGDVLHAKEPAQMAGYLLGTILLGAAVTGILGGKLSDRVGRKKVVYLSNSIVAVTSIGFCFAHTLAAVFAIGVVFGLGFGIYYSVDWALGCDVLPNPEDAARDMGVWHISMTVPQSIAPPLAAALLSSFGHTTAAGPGGPIAHYTHAGYTATFCMAAFFLMLGAVLVRNVKSVR